MLVFGNPHKRGNTSKYAYTHTDAHTHTYIHTYRCKNIENIEKSERIKTCFV